MTEINGFRPQFDKIKIDSLLFSDFANLLSAAVSVGSDTLVTASDGTQIKIKSLSPSALIASDFSFGTLHTSDGVENFVFDGVPGLEVNGRYNFVSAVATSETVVSTVQGDVSSISFADVDIGDVEFSHGANSEDLGLTLRGSGKHITIQGEFAGHGASLLFADGAVLSVEDIKARIIRSEEKTNFGDVIGYDGVESFEMVSNHLYDGGDGNDSYDYVSGSSNLYVNDSGSTGTDTLVLPSSIDASQIVIRHSADGEDAIVEILSNGAQISLVGELATAGSSDNVDAIAFSNKIVKLSPLLRQQLRGSDLTLLAGAGNDTLVGGQGSHDTFVYGSADGNLEIDAHVFSSVTFFNTLQLTDLNAADVTLTRLGSDLVVTVNATGRVITVPSEFWSTTHDGIQQIAFADGSIMTRDQIQAAAWYRAGAGNVTVSSQDGDATMQAGVGNDTLVAGDRENGGSTTVVYGSADGNLEFDAHVYSWHDLTNTLRLTDLNATDVTLSRVNGDLVVTVNATGRVITVPGEFWSTPHDGIQQIAFADGSIMTRDQIQAAAWYRAGAGNVTVSSQDGDATMQAGVGNDTLVAGDRENGGSTTVVYGSADGNLEFDAHVYSWHDLTNTLRLTDLNAADVTLSRVNGDLVVTVNATGRAITVPSEFWSTTHDGIQQIAFADGSIMTRDQIQAAAWYRAGAGNVTVSSQDGGGTMAAGIGNDTLVAGDRENGGSTTVVYGSADGNLEFDAHVYSWHDLTNTLRLTDLNATDVTLSRVNGDLVVTVNATGRVITVPGEFWSTPHDGIQQIAFADGSIMTRDQIQAAAWYRAGAGNVTVSSQDGGGTMAAGIGNDTLVAGDRENGGSTTVVYGSADGNLEFDAHVYSWHDLTNTLRLTDLNATDVTLSRVNGDLVVTVNATGRAITVPSEFWSTTHDGIQEIAFADGSIMTRDQIDRVSIAYTPPAGSDSAAASSDGNGTLNYFNGGGTITFQAGADSNVAVDYNNYGSKGAIDVFKYASADGHVWIRDTSAANDVLEFTDLKSTDVSFARVDNRNGSDTTGGDLLITVTSTGKTVTLDNFNVTSLPVGPETFIFADGVSLTKQQVLNSESMAAPSRAQIRFDGAFSYKNLTNNLGSPTADIYFDAKGDTIETHGGSDVFHYVKADGQVNILDYQAQVDTLKFDDMNLSDVTLRQATVNGQISSDLQVVVNTTGAVIDVLGQFSASNPTGVGSIVFADGTALNAAQIVATVSPGTPFVAEPGPAYTLPAGSDSAAASSDGNGTLNYFNGGGTITFQAGADSNVAVDYNNYGSKGAIDVFKYASADGHVWIRDTSAANDVLEFIDLKSTDVSFARVDNRNGSDTTGGDLLITVTSTGKTVTLDNFNVTSLPVGPETFIFADGVSLTKQQVLSSESMAAPSRAQIRFDGAFSYKNLTNNLGSPTADIYFDAKGDTIETHGGSDVFHYVKADGQVNILDYQAQVDTLKFDDLNLSDVTLSKASNDLQVVVNATGAVIDVRSQFSASNTIGIGSIAFADGTKLNSAEIASTAAVEQVSSTATATAPASAMLPTTMTPGSMVETASGFHLDFQTDGNVVIYNASHGVIWASNSQTSNPGDLVMQDDGNLVAYDTAGHAYWSSGTNGDSRAVAILGEDGTLRITNADGSQIFWHSNGPSVPPSVIQSTAGSDAPAMNGTYNWPSVPDGNYVVTFPAGVDSNVNTDNDHQGGTDVFKYSSADGNIGLRDRFGGSDVVEFMDIKSTDVTWASAWPIYENGGDGKGDSLVVTDKLTGKSVTIDLWVRDGGPSTFVFADGVSYNRSQIMSLIDTAHPLAAQYRFNGRDSTIAIGTQYGSPAVSEVWFDAQSVDNVTVTSGMVTYHYVKADGRVNILDYQAQVDTLKFDDLNLSDVTLRQAPVVNGQGSSDLQVVINATGATIDVLGQFSASNPTGVGSIVFADGTSVETNASGTTFSSGTLELSTVGALGSGNITFAGAATLVLDAPALTNTGDGHYDFANLIAGATSTSQVIDLTSLGYSANATYATLTGTNVDVSNGTTDVTLHLASVASGATFKTASDGHGGTFVYDPPADELDPATSTNSATASQTTTGYVSSTSNTATFGAPMHDPYSLAALAALTSSAGVSDPTMSISAGIDTSWVASAMENTGGVSGEAYSNTSPHDPYALASLSIPSAQAHTAPLLGQGGAQVT